MVDYLKKDFNDEDWNAWDFCAALAEETTKNLTDEQKKELAKVFGISENTPKDITRKDIREQVEWVKKNDGVAWFSMGHLADGRKLALVIGWSEGYEKDKCYIQKKEGDTLYTICSKLAVNIDDLQCDYDFDWYMPWSEDGEVWDTETTVPTNYKIPLDWYIEKSKEMLEAFKKGEIVCDTRK